MRKSRPPKRRAYQKAYWAEYYLAHRQETIDRVIAYYKAHPEKKRAERARYYAKHKEEYGPISKRKRGRTGVSNHAPAGS